MSKDYFEGKEQHISKLVLQGFTSGYYPHWNLIADQKILEDESSVERISELIKQGYIEGYHPYWKLSDQP